MRVPLPTSRHGRLHRLSLWDLAWALASPVLALWLGAAQIFTEGQWELVGAYWLLSAAAAIVGFLTFRIQDGMARYFSVHDGLDVVKAVVLSEAVTFVVLFTITRLDGIPRSTPFIHGLLLAAALIASRMFARLLHSKDGQSLNYYIRPERMLVIGANGFSSAFVDLLNSFAPGEQRVVGLLDEKVKMVGRAISGVRILGTPQQLETIVDEFAIHGISIERVVVAGESDLLGEERLGEIDRVCHDKQIELSFLPRMLGMTEWHQPEGNLVAAAAAGQVPANQSIVRLRSFFWFKRLIDVAGSITMIVGLLPILLVGALLCLIDVGPPILFWQQRLGRDGRGFLIYKFRTLGSPFGPDGTPIAEGRRLSAIGRFLRVTRIDELPQLLNVLIGDMSLIGPRPLLPEDQPTNTVIRLLVRPGITGWAQVNGGKLVTPEQKEQLDEWYVRNASLWVDIRIVLLTLKMVFGSTESPEALADADQAQNKNVVPLRPVSVTREPANQITAMRM